MTERSLDEISEIDIWCHSHNVALIATQTAGVFGYIFNDFGNDFIVTDTNGEPPAQAIVTSISQVRTVVVVMYIVFISG